MDKYGVNTQRWRLAETAAEARAGAEDLKAAEFVVKAQVHAGGRGKGVFGSGFKGGVHLCTEPADVERLAGSMLGERLHTKQTPEDGVLVRKVMVAESLQFSREFYFAILMDRAYNGPVMVASPHGGMDIEQVAEDTPEQIYKEGVDVVLGPQPEQTRRLAERMGFEGEEVMAAAQEQMCRLYDLFINSDATQVEINPLVQTDDKRVYAVDAKINFDDNALFRQQEVLAMRDTAEEDPRDVRAEKLGLSYVGMDGSIGCLVNGAGLAMATMDIIKLHGGEPANFLDVGGGTDVKRVTEAFKLLTDDKNVKGILVNIFGGIVRCDVIAEGIVHAAKEVGLNMPLVVRLAGTNVEIGQKVLKESGLPIITASDLDDAAQKAVAATDQ